jgi:sortase (surface protein transpeptidase)
MKLFSVLLPYLLMLIILTACQSEHLQTTAPLLIPEKASVNGKAEALNEQSEISPLQPSEPALNSAEAYTEESIVPVRIQIPRIQVDAEVEKVGILENGQMGVPKEEMNVGWFEPGYKPGQSGSAVLAGHVDNKTGPSIFFYLKTLEKGDKVLITGEDGTTLSFVVKNLASYKTEESPIGYIFGKSDIPRLNLITCTGTYNKKTRQHEKRLVVFTELEGFEHNKQNLANDLVKE